MESTIAYEIMSTELVVFREGDTVEDALKLLINNNITGLPVVGADNRMVGVLSEYDLIHQLSKHEKLAPEIFHEIAEFSKNPVSLSEKTLLRDVVKFFIDSKYRRVPIVDSDQRLVGIITRRDLMRMYYYRAKLA